MMAALCFAAYLLGSIPFGLILAHMFGYGDLRKIGSGNIGATNALRTGNKLLAFLTLIFDGGKGALAAHAGHVIDVGSDVAVWMGIWAVIGHCFPIWLNFKGGKGVATALGVVLVLDWQLGLGLLGIWLLIAFTLRLSSLAAITAFIAAPLLTWFMEKTILTVPMLLLGALIVLNHRENIGRIIQGNERKIGGKK